MKTIHITIYVVRPEICIYERRQRRTFTIVEEDYNLRPLKSQFIPKKNDHYYFGQNLYAFPIDSKIEFKTFSNIVCGTINIKESIGRKN